MFVTRFPTLSWLQYSMLLRRNFLSAFPTAPWGTVPRGTAPWETVDRSEMLDPTSRYDMLTHPQAILIGDIHPDWQRRLFCGVVNIGETMRKVHVRVDVHLNTSWLWTFPPKFGRILRILSAGAYSARPKKPSQRVAVPNPPPFHHGGGGRVQLYVGYQNPFDQCRILESLMIQNFRPNLNRQINSYVSKLFPSGIIPKDMKYAV